MLLPPRTNILGSDNMAINHIVVSDIVVNGMVAKKCATKDRDNWAVSGKNHCSSRMYRIRLAIHNTFYDERNIGPTSIVTDGG